MAEIPDWMKGPQDSVPAASDAGYSSRTSEQFLSRDHFINLLAESGLSEILGPNIAYLPSEIPEGTKMGIKSIITGQPPLNLTWTGDIACGDPHWGFLDTSKHWRYTSRIDFYYSSFNDWIEYGEPLERSDVVHDYIARLEGDPDAPPPTYYQIEEAGVQYYVAGDFVQRELTTPGADMFGKREFDIRFHTIFIPTY